MNQTKGLLKIVGGLLALVFGTWFIFSGVKQTRQPYGACPYGASTDKDGRCVPPAPK